MTVMIATATTNTRKGANKINSSPLLVIVEQSPSPCTRHAPSITPALTCTLTWKGAANE